MKISVGLLLLLSGTAFAAGDGPSSLISAGVNVVLFLGMLAFILSKKLPSFFSAKSENISEMINRAASKAKEAQMMMEAQKEKTSGLDSEISKLKEDSEKIISEYEKNYVSEVTERIAKLKEDADQKIDAEKAEMLNELNSNLLDLVINNAKEQIKSNEALANSATENIVKGL